MLGGGHVFEFLLGHGLVHLFRGALEFGFGRLAALGGEGRAGGFLLGFGLGFHGTLPFAGAACVLPRRI